MQCRHIVAAITAAAIASAAGAQAPKCVRTTPELLAEKLGKPQRVVSSENEKPRPPLVSRLLYYDRAGVYIALVPDAPAGAPPPYKAWCLLGAADIKTKQPVKLDEAAARIKKAR